MFMYDINLIVTSHFFPGSSLLTFAGREKLANIHWELIYTRATFFIIEINLNNLMYFFNYHETINVIAMKINNALTIKFDAMIT